MPKILVNKLDTELHKNLPKFSWKKIYFYYLIYYVSEQQIKQKNKEYCSLDSAYLKNVTVSNVHRYIKYLKDVQVFISDGHFTQGKKSYYYKINESFLVGDYCKIEINPADKLFSKIHQQITNQKAHVSRLKPHLKEMRKELMNIKIDHVNAFKWISENTTDGKKKFSHITSIEKLKDKRLRYFNRNKTNNRLDTNLTNLKSELKQFIIGDYTSIDLCNSQPFLLSTLLNNIINNNSSYCCYLYMDKLKETFGIKRIESVLKLNQNQEKCNLVNLSSYSNSVINGTLYDDFIIEYNGNLTRKEVKNIMFGVLFSGNVKPNSFIVPYAKEKKVFASVYPFIYDCIFNLKHNDKENNLLPIYLQKLESYLFIDCIAKELVNNNIVPLTIHDSVIVANKDVETTLCIIKSIFNKELGVIPSFSIEAI